MGRGARCEYNQNCSKLPEPSDPAQNPPVIVAEVIVIDFADVSNVPFIAIVSPSVAVKFNSTELPSTLLLFGFRMALVKQGIPVKVAVPVIGE